MTSAERRHSLDPGQRPPVRALLQSLAARSRHHRHAAALLRSLPRAIGHACRSATAISARPISSPPAISSSTCRSRLPIPTSLAALKTAVGERIVIAGASTHAGEETMLIEAHRRLRGSFPRLLTIIAPRHPDRGPGILEMAQAAGLKASAALARGIAGARHRTLCRRHAGRARPDLSAGADRVRRRLAREPRRPESDRADQARRGHSARAATSGTSPKSMPRSTSRTAPKRWPTSASSWVRRGCVAQGRRRAHGGGRGRARDGRRARRRARAHARRARALSHANSSRTSRRRCVSRHSGGARRGSLPRCSRLWRGLWHGRGGAAAAAWPACRRAGRSASAI